ncbi:unnamed protein product [Miscanthus lutarioriparius]|uniref:Protein FAR1-RELATED SEQUENCE n=1 Tax=Miscanthus lutarioriparius TaxID=422564 RepID=A0A811MJN9_9POAL|nr:unnamed protein product [Miscanthus lutarioriparius]
MSLRQGGRTGLIDLAFQDNEWVTFLYENRHLWAPAFLKDTFWAGLCTVSQRESQFQGELKATMHCQGQLDGSASSFIVIDLTEAGSEMLNKKYEVVHCMATNKMECNCGLFLFSGIVCRHALSVLKWQQVYDIPPCYVLKADFKQLHYPDNPPKDLATSNHVEHYDYISLQFLRLVEIGMTSDEKYRHAVRLLKDMKETLLDDNLCRDLEQKLTPAERATVNGDNHTQPGSSEGGPAKKRRGSPPKKNKEINVDSMEEVHPSELSFDSRYGVLQSGHSHHFGNQLNAGNTLQEIGSGILLCLDFGAPRTLGSSIVVGMLRLGRCSGGFFCRNIYSINLTQLTHHLRKNLSFVPSCGEC